MNQGRTAREEKEFFLFQAAEMINLAEWMKRSAQISCRLPCCIHR